MRAITVDEVFAAVAELLGASRPAALTARAQASP
jgi:hypothetical protein